MPTYDLKNIKTGEVKEMFLTISKKEEMLASGEWEQKILGAPATVTHTGNIVNKTSGDWKNLLENIKKGSGGNTGLSKEKKRKYGFQDNSIQV